MLGLRKCSEDDFNYFKGTNERYMANSDKMVWGSFSCISIFSGIVFVFALISNSEQKKVLGIGFLISIIITTLFYNTKRLGLKRYIYKYQKCAVIINSISMLLFSLSAYLVPLVIISLEKNNKELMKIMLSAISIGFIYIVILLIKICKLIKKGETRNEECINIYGQLGRKLATIGIGCSIPVIVVANKLSHIFVTQINSNIGSTILVIITSFIIQVVISIFIPEGIILLYCKFRFESFNIPYKEEGPPVFKGVDKNKYKQPRKKKRRNY